MRAYGPNGLRAPRMAKALGDWTYFFFYLEAYHLAGGGFRFFFLHFSYLFNLHSCA